MLATHREQVRLEDRRAHADASPLRSPLSAAREAWRLFRARGTNPVLLAEAAARRNRAVHALTSLAWALVAAACAVAMLGASVGGTQTPYLIASSAAHGSIVVLALAMAAVPLLRLRRPVAMEELLLLPCTRGEIAFGLAWPLVRPVLVVWIPALVVCAVAFARVHMLDMQVHEQKQHWPRRPWLPSDHWWFALRVFLAAVGMAGGLLQWAMAAALTRGGKRVEFLAASAFLPGALGALAYFLPTVAKYALWTFGMAPAEHWLGDQPMRLWLVPLLSPLLAALALGSGTALAWLMAGVCARDLQRAMLPEALRDPEPEPLAAPRDAFRWKRGALVAFAIAAVAGVAAVHLQRTLPIRYHSYRATPGMGFPGDVIEVSARVTYLEERIEFEIDATDEARGRTLTPLPAEERDGWWTTRWTLGDPRESLRLRIENELPNRTMTGIMYAHPGNQYGSPHLGGWGPALSLWWRSVPCAMLASVALALASARLAELRGGRLVPAAAGTAALVHLASVGVAAADGVWAALEHFVLCLAGGALAALVSWISLMVAERAPREGVRWALLAAATTLAIAAHCTGAFASGRSAGVVLAALAPVLFCAAIWLGVQRRLL